MSGKTWIIIVFVVVFLIVLPTFTPEDLVTTIPLISVLGWKGYALLCVGLLGLAFFCCKPAFYKVINFFK